MSLAKYNGGGMVYFTKSGRQNQWIKRVKKFLYGIFVVLLNKKVTLFII